MTYSARRWPGHLLKEIWNNNVAKSNSTQNRNFFGTCGLVSFQIPQFFFFVNSEIGLIVKEDYSIKCTPLALIAMLIEENIHFDKTIFLLERDVECYIHLLWFGKTDCVNNNQFEICSFNKMSIINCHSSAVPDWRLFIQQVQKWVNCVFTRHTKFLGR